MAQSYKEVIEDFISQKDWRVRENSNTSYSFSSLILNLTGYCIANYILDEIYGDMRISDWHREGRVHIHDLGQGIIPYCCGWSLQALLQKGISGIPGMVDSAPAKHFRSAINHIVNFIGCVTNEAAGAQAFNSVDTYLSGLIYKDYQSYKEKYGEKIALDLIDREVKQSIQELVFHLNYHSRWGSQSPFSNFTIDLTVPPDMIDAPVWIGTGYDTDVTYRDMQRWLDLFNYHLFNTMYEGDATGKGFTFPIITINVTPDTFDIISKDVKSILLNSIAKFGTCYIQNCVNGRIGGDKKIDPTVARAMCCRLQLDLNELSQKFGGLFGSGDYTGSVGVVTLNLAMFAYEAAKKEKSLDDRVSDFLTNLEDAIKESHASIQRKRELCIKHLEMGLLPFMKEFLPTKFKTHFNTIGYVGLHEALVNLGVEDGLLCDEGQELGKKILIFMRDKIKQLQEETGVLSNLEATPSEGASYRLAKALVKKYPDAYVSGDGKTPYLTNSCHIPAEYQGDLAYVINMQEELQCQHTGGTVVHFYLGEVMTSKQIEFLIKKICETKIPYFSLTTVYSYCPVHGYIPGRHDICPYPHTDEELEEYGVDIDQLKEVMHVA